MNVVFPEPVHSGQDGSISVEQDLSSPPCLCRRQRPAETPFCLLPCSWLSGRRREGDGIGQFEVCEAHIRTIAITQPCSKDVFGNLPHVSCRAGCISFPRSNLKISTYLFRPAIH